MRTAVILVVFFMCACQRGAEGPTPEVVRDVKKLCNAEALSGADDPGQTTARSFVIANYLADNLETPQVLGLLGDFKRTPLAQKEAFLRQVAKIARLEECPLADTWAAHAAKAKASTSEPSVQPSR